MALGAGDTARVEAQYVLAPAPAALELRALARPCAVVTEVRVERGGAPLALAEEDRGPWRVWRDTAVGAGDSLALRVSYVVVGQGPRVSIPLLHPAAPIPRRDGEREGPVRLTLRAASAESRVTFPHLARQAPGEWSARFAAVPAFVDVEHPGRGDAETPCVDAAAAQTTDGGLVWRFLTLIGIMVAWVPIYMLWARRSAESDA